MPYEIRPTKDQIKAAMDKRTEFSRYALLNIVFVFICIVGAVVSGSYIALAIAAIICLINAIRANKWANIEKTHITDVSTSYIEFDGKILLCRQANQDTYEECDIHMDEVQQILEDTEDGAIGYCIYLTPDHTQSKIYVDGNVVERSLFYVSGYGYEIDKFKEMYQKVTNSLIGATISKSESQSNWNGVTETIGFRKLIAPWIVVGFLAVARIVALFVGVSIPGV